MPVAAMKTNVGWLTSLRNKSISVICTRTVQQCFSVDNFALRTIPIIVVTFRKCKKYALMNEDEINLVSCENGKNN